MNPPRLGRGTPFPPERASAADGEKLREVDPARCREPGGIAPDGVRKEVAGGAADRRNKQPLGHALATIETRLTTRASGALGKR